MDPTYNTHTALERDGVLTVLQPERDTRDITERSQKGTCSKWCSGGACNKRKRREEVLIAAAVKVGVLVVIPSKHRLSDNTTRGEKAVVVHPTT